jgi:hypothetical protein
MRDGDMMFKVNTAFTVIETLIPAFTTSNTGTSKTLSVVTRTIALNLFDAPVASKPLARTNADVQTPRRSQR